MNVLYDEENGAVVFSEATMAISFEAIERLHEKTKPMLEKRRVGKILECESKGEIN